MLDEYCLVNTEHIRLTLLLFHYLWFRITDVCYGVKVVITSGWGKELIGETTVTLIRSMKPERSFVGYYTLSLVSKQNADVGRCLAWKKRWALEHLSVYSSRNTNLLENKRGKNFFFPWSKNLGNIIYSVLGPCLGDSYNWRCWNSHN